MCLPWLASTLGILQSYKTVHKDKENNDPEPDRPPPARVGRVSIARVSTSTSRRAARATATGPFAVGPRSRAKRKRRTAPENNGPPSGARARTVRCAARSRRRLPGPGTPRAREETAHRAALSAAATPLGGPTPRRVARSSRQPSRLSRDAGDPANPPRALCLCGSLERLDSLWTLCVAWLARGSRITDSAASPKAQNIIYMC